MTPRAAARGLVGLVLRRWFRDVMELIDPMDSPIEDKQKAAYARLEREVRKRLGAPVEDLDHLYDAVTEAVPEEHRAGLCKAFDAYANARVAQLTITQEAAYLLGIEVGRTFTRRGVRALGGRR